MPLRNKARTTNHRVQRKGWGPAPLEPRWTLGGKDPPCTRGGGQRPTVPNAPQISERKVPIGKGAFP